MGYMLNEDIAKIITNKYKNSYIASKMGISSAYVSFILHRKRCVPKRIAYAFAKTINAEYEVEDLFELVNN